MHSWSSVIYECFIPLCTGVEERGDWHSEEILPVACVHVWSQLRDVPQLCHYVAITIT